MKKQSNFYKAITILALLVSCEKSVDEPTYAPYTPSNFSLDAGSWKTYILSSPTEVSIMAPKATTDNDYLKEIDSLKRSVLPNLSAAQKEAVSYWGVGAVYRWNELARELAAKYNLAPAANAAGIYPVPDRANPLAEPKFPFANPPYTARMLAYLSVAQYDALVSSSSYKAKYNRKAPSFYDKDIKPLLPVSEVATYPSEEAVVAATSYTILLSMFPGEGPYLSSKLTEATNARLWAGVNVRSDITAGVALGKAVAAKVLQKANTDGMSSANNQSLVTAQKDAAKNRGIKDLWLSQEKPARPPMLPNFGAVETWNFNKATLEQIRPAIPYIVGSAEWNKDLEELDKINKSQSREQARIANYWADGTGSYTPPGHWAREAANLCYQNKYSEVATARTMALVCTALMDAGIACWDTKYYYYTPRPQQFGIKTSVGLPNFPSYTSGHSTFSAAAATVLASLFPSDAARLNAKAKEASESRVFGLIHFRVDCEMGLTHGKKIGEYALKRGKADGSKL
jgi:hypothetical protein